MPLHLLGKKSWNVYNADNIARVRRDEAAARAREEAEEQRMQEVDAARRLAILRGETPPPLASAPTENEHGHGPGSEGRGRERRKRKRAGEDDTDFEMRVARERADDGDRRRGAGRDAAAARADAPIVDDAGHIALFARDDGAEAEARRGGKNEEAEREAARRRREFEDQYTMRFANAAGRGGLVGGGGPWYASAGQGGRDGAAVLESEPPGKDVWGNEDPRRRDREAARVVASDPLAMMKRGAAKVREVEKDRRRYRDGRDRDLRRMIKEERRESKRQRRRDGREGDLDQVGRDKSSLGSPDRRRREREKERHHSRHGESRHRHGDERHHDGHRREQALTPSSRSR